MGTMDEFDAIEELLPGYALNALNEEETLAVEAALDREPRYRRLLAEHLEAIGLLAASHAAAVPSAAIRERLMEQARSTPSAASPVAEERGESRARRAVPPRALQGLVAALAVAVVGAAGYLVVQQFPGENPAPPIAADTPAVARVEASDDRRELEELSDAITRPGTAIAQLRPLPVSASATLETTAVDTEAPAGIVAIDDKDDSMLVAVRLPRLDRARIYHAWWWDKEGRPAKAAVFSVDEKGYARIVLIGDPRRMRSLTVNVEPADGAEAPSQEVILTGLLPNEAPDEP